jgi:hypothetical protein
MRARSESGTRLLLRNLQICGERAGEADEEGGVEVPGGASSTGMT